MKTGFLKKFLLATAMFSAVVTTQAQFVAFNDHSPGDDTHPNATTYNMLPNTEPGPTGPLKNIITGETLPVTLNIQRSGFVLAETTFGEPAPGTPLAQTFGGFVDFSGFSTNNARIASAASSISYVISGLQPGVTYLIQGGAVVGSDFTDRYTKFSLVGADNYVNEHTAGAITSITEPSLMPNQVAINTGQNHLPGTGVMFQWNSVDPGDDGTITILCQVYGGPIPGGTAVNNYGNGLTALKISEQVIAPPEIQQDPIPVVASVGGPATFSVLASGYPLNYQWLKNGNVIQGATGSSYTIPSVNAFDNGSLFSVRVSNQLGTVTSRQAELIILPPPVVLLPFNKVWRYDDSGQDLGTGWRETTFVDTSWKSGAGPLGLETTPANLPIPLGTTFASLNGSITYYFRATFIFNGNPNDVGLVMTNMFDDGGVIYLNGTEVFRSDILPEGPVDAFTPATPAVGDAAFATFTLPADRLVTGTNTVAVEMHQANTTSSDMVFGLHLTAQYLPPGPLSIITQPEDVVVEENKSFTLSVEVQGNAARYQWYKDGEIIPGATRREYSVEFADLVDDPGVYQVNVRNPFSDLVSQSVMVSVIPDIIPPELLTADGSRNRTNILVSFSENVDEKTATNIANYTLKSSYGQVLQVMRAGLTNGTNILLTTAARDAAPSTNNYLLTVNNVRDLASMTNVVATNSTVPVFSVLKLVGVHRTWRFYDPFPFFPLNQPLFPGNGWEQPVFTENSIWDTGPAPFYFDNGNNELPVAKEPATRIDQGSITKYFRSGFNFTASTLGAVFRMQHIVDDGAIFYLNGSEFIRYNLPEGLVNENTAVPGSNGVSVARLITVETPTELLQLGTNVLAVELHGTNTFDIDWVFTMDFEVRYNSVSMGPVIITKNPQDLTVEENSTARFTFDGVGPSTYQWYVNNNPVQGANKATFVIEDVPKSLSGATVHVVASNSGSMATSGQAILTVIPDVIPPVLLSANKTNDNQVLIKFSEPLNELSAVFPGNYVVESSTGVQIPSSSAQLLGPTFDTVLLTLSGTLPNQPHTLTVNGVADRAEIPNAVAMNSAVTIGFSVILITWDENHMWRYLDSLTDPMLDPSWKEVDFADESMWPQGAALFGEEDAGTPVDIRTDVPQQDNKITFYFRTQFMVEGDPAGTYLQMREILDDGAVYYLNGSEVRRNRMPTGNVVWSTLANGTVGNAAIEGPVIIPSTALRAGMNVMAVEVHQASATSSDVVFGIELEQVFQGAPLECPELQLQVLPDGRIQISWPANSPCVLQQSLALPGSWLNVPNVTNPYVVNPTGTARFFRLEYQF